MVSVFVLHTMCVITVFQFHVAHSAADAPDHTLTLNPDVCVESPYHQCQHVAVKRDSCSMYKTDLYK